MKTPKIWIALATMVLAAPSANAYRSANEAKDRGAREIRGIVEKFIDSKCQTQCQLIGIEVEADVAVGDQVAPGFEDGPAATLTIAPAAGKVKLLMDEAVGSVSRQKLLALLKTQLGGLGYPVTVDAQVMDFPQPANSALKVVELRDRVSRQIRENIEGVLKQYCPEACLMGEFDVTVENVNAEEAQYGSTAEFVQESGTAVRIRNVKATILMDQSLPDDEMSSLVEMVKLKTNGFKNVTIDSKVMKFPRPTVIARKGLSTYAARGLASDGEMSDEELAKRKQLDEKISTTDSKLNSLSATQETKSQTASNTLSQEEKKSFLNDLKENLTRREEYAQKSKEDRAESTTRIEKIERVESGDAVQKVLGEFKLYGGILSAIVLALLVTLVAVGFRRAGNQTFGLPNMLDFGKKHDGHGGSDSGKSSEPALTNDERATLIAMRVEADKLQDELMQIFAEHPKVAKFVFSQVLTEEGVETTGQYIQMFGETIVMDLLKDPTLQADLTELMDFYARSQFDTNDDERLSLLRRLHHRTVAGKLAVHGSRSASLFDFLSEMDSPQIQEMIRNESNTVKAIVLTQCDPKKRQVIFNAYDESQRIKLMAELTRIDHLPKNYIYNVSSALKRKKAENPRLNTESMPGTDVLVTLLERAPMDAQRSVMLNLLNSTGDVLQNVKAKLVSLETIRFLKDSHLVEVITAMKHDELIQFLKGANQDIREAVLSKAPQDLAIELREELQMTEPVGKEIYQSVERKVLNKIKVLANQGLINLNEVNEKMFAAEFGYTNASHSQPAEVTRADQRRAG